VSRQCLNPQINSWWLVVTSNRLEGEAHFQKREGYFGMPTTKTWWLLA
jgi:hypothetical protein